MDKRYNILYKGNIVHKERTIEECSEILDTAQKQVEAIQLKFDRHVLTLFYSCILFLTRN